VHFEKNLEGFERKKFVGRRFFIRSFNMATIDHAMKVEGLDRSQVILSNYSC
jgi:hypothetical protein